LGRFTGKQYSGEVIPKWYEEKNYRAIEQYIQEEAREFIKLYQMLKKRIPKIIQVEEMQMRIGKIELTEAKKADIARTVKINSFCNLIIKALESLKEE